MKTMRKTLVLIIGLTPFTLSTAETVDSYTTESDGVLCQTSGGKKLKLQVCSGNIIRVVYTSQATIPAPQGLVVSKTSFTPGTWNATDNGTAIVLTTPKVTATVTKSNAAISFANSSGTAICSEVVNGRTLTAVTKGGVAGFSGTLAFDSPTDEGVYGLGNLSCKNPLWPSGWWGANCPDNGVGVLNYRSLTADMRQCNWYDVIPFFMTTRGYGVLMNFMCHAVKNPPLNFIADFLLNKNWDYYFIYGPQFDTIISGYRDLTGSAPMLSKWAYGFWQCKNRYQSATELTNAVSGFRSRNIPLDCIVQDWQWWLGTTSGWGSFVWNSNYPNPGSMITTIHNNNCHFAVSLWEIFSPGYANYTTMQPYLFSCSANGGTYFDVFNATAAQLYWNMVDTSLFTRGVDGWWMDATEPECPQLTGFNCGMGMVDLVSNAYSLVSCKSIYEKQRAVSSAKRVVNLTRSFYAGQQRFGTIYWNGDLHANDIDQIKMTVIGGLNSCMAGNPYWCSDIGGFNQDCNPGTAACEEIFTRWFEVGTFFPIFRVHGTRNTEIYNYNATTQAACIAFDQLRYRLMPYIYSLAWKVTKENYTITRALPFDFPSETNVRTIGDQFMYGPVFLVNPVLTMGATTRSLYLPLGRWNDFWTGDTLGGGRTLTGVAAPISRIPVYCRGGSILPMGPNLQWATQKQADTIELRVYPGANGSFTLYEDESDNYNYETGSYATIPITYTDNPRCLRIGARSGSFTGMLSSRRFNVVYVSNGHGAGGGITTNPDTSVLYSGSLVQCGTCATGVVEDAAPISKLMPLSMSRKVATDHLVFDNAFAGKTKSVTVYDLGGKLLAMKTIKKNAFSLRKDLGIPNGIYIVKIKTLP